ncbi:MAG: hypothetical protein DMD81_22740 [Candidatus Rokuibacteriota bacterium]|nr:MAG: hypothetical protein DMD81_22740 [Candidatus Rokubacteria bacterium]
MVVLAIWWLFGKKILGFLLVRGVAKGALKEIGKSALAQQPDWITLTKISDPQWRNRAAIEEWTTPLRAGGFIDAGVFTVDKMPGVKINILVKPTDCVMANVYEHPQAGTWIELVSHYRNGESATLTTMKDLGMTRPSWITSIFVGKAPAMELVQRLMTERRTGELIAVSPERAPRQFEEGYAKYMLGKKNMGLSAEEVATQVKRWTEGKPVGK